MQALDYRVIAHVVTEMCTLSRHVNSSVDNEIFNDAAVTEMYVLTCSKVKR